MTKQRKDFTFRYQPYQDSADGVLLSFLQAGDGVRSGREMIIQALRMCYLALAYQQAGSLSDEKLRQLGLTCCHALEQQLTYLRQTLHLPVSAASATAIIPTAASFGAPIEMSQPVALTTSSANSKCKPVVESDALLPGKGSFQDETGLFDGI